MEMLRATSGHDLLIQTAHCPVIAMAGSGRARATTTIHEFIRGPGGAEPNFEQYGIYFDDVAQVEGSWKFAHRLFVPIYVGRDCVTGDIPASRTALLRPE